MYSHIYVYIYIYMYIYSNAALLRPLMCTAKEPYLSANEPLISTKELCLSAKEPCIPDTHSEKEMPNTVYHKRALYIHNRALCIHQRARKRAPHIHK